MAAQSNRSAVSAFSNRSYQTEHDVDDDSDGATWVLQPEERITPPARGRRSDAALAVAIAVLIVLGSGMVLFDDRMREPVPASTSTPPAETAALPGPRPPEPDLPTTTLPAAPEPAGLPDDRAATAADAPAPTVEAALEPAEPLSPPSVDKDKPYQVRALSVGLHPGLSEALLTRLSADDYRNAGVAIRTALAETADGQTYVWPTQATAGQAQFHVRFVLGPAPNCRRYVVTVMKDRWATTALPMEKCGGGTESGPAGRG